jgi:CheY-like chemotaxis protein
MSTCILLVEDDDLIREAMAAILMDEGYEVVKAENGQAALNWLLHNPAPRMILLDLYMPIMSGMDFRQRQLENPALAAIPVVVVTAAGESAAPALSALPQIRKPIDLEELLHCVETHCQTGAAG